MQHVALNLPCIFKSVSYLEQRRQITSPYLRTFHSGTVLNVCIL